MSGIHLALLGMSFGPTDFLADFLVVAGGGGSTAVAGGGAGGYRCSVTGELSGGGGSADFHPRFHFKIAGRHPSSFQFPRTRTPEFKSARQHLCPHPGGTQFRAR